MVFMLLAFALLGTRDQGLGSALSWHSEHLQIATRLGLWGQKSDRSLLVAVNEVKFALRLKSVRNRVPT